MTVTRPESPERIGPKFSFRARFRPCGDTGLAVELGEGIDLAVNRAVHRLRWALEALSLPGIEALTPSYRSLLIQYDPARRSMERLMLDVESVLEGGWTETDPGRVIEIPVNYGGPEGPDLDEVAAHARLSPEEVVRRHSGVDYPVYLIGFTPGFPYLGGMDPSLCTPRKATPRERVPAGSVGIAETQTGIYPIDSPGGWQLIGRTPWRLFDPSRAEPFLVRAGDTVRFVPLSISSGGTP